MVAPTGRPVLSIALDEATHDEILTFCDRQGVTASSLFEAFARIAVSQDPSPRLRVIVEDARQIAADRRRRRPD